MILENLTRRWPGNDPVFSDLNLEVTPGFCTCLLGPSGCGKSTLLRCAASLDVPEKGRILIDGEEAAEPSPDRQLILQDDSQLLPWLSVEDNVLFPRRMGIAGGIGGFEARSLLELVGLPDAGSLYPVQLSGGMRQRAVLARALAADPRYLLLDEPFAALDAEIRSRLHRVLTGILGRRNLTVLLVTHDVGEALMLADRLVYMDANGSLSRPEPNPLGQERNPEDPQFFSQTIRMRRRYESLVEAVDPDAPVG
jgi:NitT/TauT family transport system ATP-binding protein